MKTALLILLSAAGPLAAEPFLDLPIDCQLGQTCYIEAYVDSDPSKARSDFACGLRTRDGHRGVDFALDGFAALETGVSVLAAAPGIVQATRNNMPDLPPSPTFDGTNGCGNAVRIAHANGLQTLYCHLRLGSVSVQKGEVVEASQPLGLVGQSGMTNFPHLHFSVLTQDGQLVDPFAPNATNGTCGAQQETLWKEPLDYIDTGFFTAGFSTSLPTLETVTNGAARVATASTNEALVTYGHLFNARHGDVLTFHAAGPNGEIWEHSEVLKSPKRNIFRAFGRRAPPVGWDAGRYKATLTLTRAGSLIGTRYAYVSVK